jgi:2'-hydroxyisoflavone reductase
MKILVLGGTSFLGPHTVEAALASGHELTLFNRQRTHADLFPAVEKLKGDRNGDYAALAGRTWDAVIDTHAHLPRWVRLAADALKDSVGQYVFVSTISVYPMPWRAVVREDAPVERLPDGVAEEPFAMERYGALKVLCEEAAEERMPGRVTVARPGLIVGPLDPTDRFTYWPARIARGGEVLAPGNPDAEVQFVDARDLGLFLVRTIEDGHAGVFNAVGFQGRLSMQEMLHGCKAAVNTDCSLTWVDEEFLLAQEVGPWMEMPLWIPTGGEAGAHFDNAAAIAHGLSFRPPAETMRDVAAWAATRPADHRWGAGLAADKEARVLAAWRAR